MGHMAVVVDGVLSERRMHALAGDAVFERAESYVAKVAGLQIEPGRARGTVRGTDRYSLEIVWSQQELDGFCDCPHAAGGNFCKHLVALGLAVLASVTPHGADELRSPVDDYLDSLAAPALRELVLEVAGNSEAASRLLATRAALAAEDPAAVADELLDAVTATLTTRGFVDYRRSFEVGSDAQTMLDDLQGHLDGGYADEVRPALLKALTRLRTMTKHADDPSGMIGDAAQRAATLYARSCRQGHPDPVKLARWLVKFRASSPGWPSTPLSDFVEAFDAKALKSYRRGVQSLAAKEAGSGTSFEVHQMLIELADHDGDVDRAVELLQHPDHPMGHPQYGEIITRLRAVNRAREAMSFLDRAVAEQRITSGPGNDYWIGADDAAEAYLKDGRDEDALAMLRGVFRQHPDAVSYRLLLRHATTLRCADDERAWALERAEQHTGGHRQGALLVELALVDGDLDRAWVAADQHGAGQMWGALAKASAQSRPRQAADLYRPELGRRLVHADTKAYPEIARILSTMRALYVAAGEVETLDAQIRELRVDYSRRPSLIKALDRAGLPR